MQIFKNAYMIGGCDYSLSGTKWTHSDCCSYVLDTGQGLLMFDPGFHETLDEKLEVMEYWGLDPDDVRYVFITHAHEDHFTAAKAFQDRGAKIVAGAFTAGLMQNGKPHDPSAFDTIHVETDVVVPTDDEREFLGVATKTVHTEGPYHHRRMGPAGVSVFFAMFEGRRILFSGDHILFDRYGKNSWNAMDPHGAYMFEWLKDERIDAILGGHCYLHWRAWPRECPHPD